MLLDPLQSRVLLAHALQHHYAILAVNADSHAAIVDCFEAAREIDAPLIIETSLWQLEGHAFGRGDPVLGLARYLSSLAVLAEDARYRDVPVIFHTDHIKGPRTVELLTAAIRGVPVLLSDTHGVLRASTVSLDASTLTDEENIELLCRLAAVARVAGLTVTFEMESEVDAGCTPLERTRHLISAVEAREPGAVWIWAPGLGTVHGLANDGYPDFNVDMIGRNIDLVAGITGRRIGLALHGSSGLGERELVAAVKAGVVKVNWSSDSLLLRSRASREYYTTHAETLADPKVPGWKNAAMDNGLQRHIAEIYVPKVVARMRLLGAAGHGKRFLAHLAAIG